MSSNERKFGLLQVHEVRNFNSTCLNRDEYGMPKSGYFGGVYRGRVSSQCKKRVMLTDFREEYEQEYTLGNTKITLKEGYSTKNVSALLLNALIDAGELDPSDKKLMEELKGNKWFASFSSKKDAVQKFSWADLVDMLQCTVDKIKQTTTYMDSLSTEQKIDLFDYVAKKEAKSKKKTGKKAEESEAGGTGEEEDAASVVTLRKTLGTKEAMEEYISKHKKAFGEKYNQLTLAERIQFKASERPLSLDIALFGRMSVVNGVTNVPAAMQVSHALSTHALRQEVDYFVAVDDINTVGVGFLSDNNFNSCCYLTYYSIDLDLLAKNLATSLVKLEEDGSTTFDMDKFREYVRRALYTIYETIPSGKQTTYASNVRPSYMLFEHFNNKKAISYFNAIDKPVRVKQDMGLIEESINRLTEEVNTWDIGEGFKGTRVDFHANNLSYNPIQNASSYVNIHDAINAVMNSI